MHTRVTSGKRQTDWSDYPERKVAFFVRNPLIGERVASASAPPSPPPIAGPRTGTRSFPTPVLAESILDRLLNSAHQIILAGSSYRPQQRPTALRAVSVLPSNADAELPRSTFLRRPRTEDPAEPAPASSTRSRSRT